MLMTLLHQNNLLKNSFNVIPHIDSFVEDGFTKEEWKMNVETKKFWTPI